MSGGLYNVIFGHNVLAQILLSVIEVDYQDVPRFRDCFLSEDGSEIIIYTRTGGANRAHYVEENESLRKVLGFKRDEDDTFDSTYAIFYYQIPEKYRGLFATLGQEHGVNPSKRWKETLSRMRYHDGEE